MESMPVAVEGEGISSGQTDRWAALARNGPLTAVVIGLCVSMIVLWLPQYLYWPWWIDPSEFSFLAHQWDQGVFLPYRDLLCFNLPGEIYLHWILGRAAGWGNSRAFYAVDAAFVVLFGVALCAWSRRLFGGLLPGSLGYLCFLSFYLDQGFNIVAQREWHAALFTVVGLFLLQAWPGRLSRFVSALLFAVGFSFRPQVILLAPAFLLAIDQTVRPKDASWGLTVRAVLEWGVVAVAGIVLIFSPLFMSGILDDFLWGRFGLGLVSPGGTYNSDGPRLRVEFFFRPLNLTLVVVVLLNTYFAVNNPNTRRTYVTWLVALFGVMFYRPLSPHVTHEYLRHPFQVVLAVHFALMAGGLLSIPTSMPRIRLAAFALLLALAMPSRPEFLQETSISYSSVVLRGRAPFWQPPTYNNGMYSPLTERYHYSWSNYQDLLVYLEQTIPPGTRVANLLYYTPAILGKVPRPSVFPTPALNFVRSDPSFLPLYLKRLEEATDSIVVWSPEESRLNREIYTSFQTIIEKYYEPQSRFGSIEVWRRKRPGPVEDRTTARLS